MNEQSARARMGIILRQIETSRCTLTARTWNAQVQRLWQKRLDGVGMSSAKVLYVTSGGDQLCTTYDAWARMDSLLDHTVLLQLRCDTGLGTQQFTEATYGHGVLSLRVTEYDRDSNVLRECEVNERVFLADLTAKKVLGCCAIMLLYFAQVYLPVSMPSNYAMFGDELLNVYANLPECEQADEPTHCWEDLRKWIHEA